MGRGGRSLYHPRGQEGGRSLSAPKKEVVPGREKEGNLFRSRSRRKGEGSAYLSCARGERKEGRCLSLRRGPEGRKMKVATKKKAEKRRIDLPL